LETANLTAIPCPGLAAPGTETKMFLRTIRDDQAGSTATEYALIAALVVAVLVGAAGALGSQMRSTYEAIGAALP
jgi:Flp pilus assembly pilin Flp